MSGKAVPSKAVSTHLVKELGKVDTRKKRHDLLKEEANERGQSRLRREGGEQRTYPGVHLASYGLHLLLCVLEWYVARKLGAFVTLAVRLDDGAEGRLGASRDDVAVSVFELLVFRRGSRVRRHGDEARHRARGLRGVKGRRSDRDMSQEGPARCRDLPTAPRVSTGRDRRFDSNTPNPEAIRPRRQRGAPRGHSAFRRPPSDRSCGTAADGRNGSEWRISTWNVRSESGQRLSRGGPTHCERNLGNPCGVGTEEDWCEMTACTDRCAGDGRSGSDAVISHCVYYAGVRGAPPRSRKPDSEVPAGELRSVTGLSFLRDCVALMSIAKMKLND